jgi:hypothetical protein
MRQEPQHECNEQNADGNPHEPLESGSFSGQDEHNPDDQNRCLPRKELVGTGTVTRDECHDYEKDSILGANRSNPTLPKAAVGGILAIGYLV